MISILVKGRPMSGLSALRRCVRKPPAGSDPTWVHNPVDFVWQLLLKWPNHIQPRPEAPDLLAGWLAVSNGGGASCLLRGRLQFNALLGIISEPAGQAATCSMRASAFGLLSLPADLFAVCRQQPTCCRCGA